MVISGLEISEKIKRALVKICQYSQRHCLKPFPVIISVVFDPASFYGHHEFDLIPGTFGGFTKEFYDVYHKLIPKAPGFDARHKLYLLFNYLNHWYVCFRHSFPDVYDDCITQL